MYYENINPTIYSRQWRAIQSQLMALSWKLLAKTWNQLIHNTKWIGNNCHRFKFYWSKVPTSNVQWFLVFSIECCVITAWHVFILINNKCGYVQTTIYIKQNIIFPLTINNRPQTKTIRRTFHDFMLRPKCSECGSLGRNKNIFDLLIICFEIFNGIFTANSKQQTPHAVPWI